jgi:signal transduction histidine kinase
LQAFDQLRNVNERLVQSVADARSELAASEEGRRILEVANAVSSERDRLMQEMHDGIGSNLITALAVAENQKQPQTTINTLRRAITDLKITVDSLEPVEGDLVALIANLRHRMEADLRTAGITSQWSVTTCQPISWLDATNALHMLRIFQEAISNVLTHSGANIMEIGCRELAREGKMGVLTFVSDNGQGFAVHDLSANGQGISNMRARAMSMHGKFACNSSSIGTQVEVWLPYERE